MIDTQFESIVFYFPNKTWKDNKQSTMGPRSLHMFLRCTHNWCFIVDIFVFFFVLKFFLLRFFSHAFIHAYMLCISLFHSFIHSFIFHICNVHMHIKFYWNKWKTHFSCPSPVLWSWPPFACMLMPFTESRNQWNFSHDRNENYRRIKTIVKWNT